MSTWKENRSWRYAKVLAIDDEPLVTKTLMAILRTGRFVSTNSTNEPSSAFTVIDKYKPDLILLDIRMPDMDGVTLLSKIKASDDYSHIVVVMLTGHGEEKKMECLDLGAADYIEKPVDPSELLLRVRNALRMSLDD